LAVYCSEFSSIYAATTQQMLAEKSRVPVTGETIFIAGSVKYAVAKYRWALDINSISFYCSLKFVSSL